MAREIGTWLVFVLSTIVGLAYSPAEACAQIDAKPTVRIHPGKIQTGDSFVVEIEVSLPTGRTLRTTESPSVTRGIRPTGSPSVVSTEAEGGAALWTLSLPFVALRPGYLPLPAFEVLIGSDGTGGGDDGPVGIPLGGVMVQSVLPPPGEPIEPGSLVFPESTPRQNLTTPLLLLLPGLLAGALWVISHTPKVFDPAATSSSKTPGGDTSLEDLRNQLVRILRRTPSSPAELASVLDEALPVLRKLLGCRSSSDLSSLTTPELLDLLQHGQEPDVDANLGRALRSADGVRFRPEAPTFEEILEFRADLMSWLEGHREATALPGGHDA
jgi:hypothetical protein